jgi:hypothetical protein
MRRQRQIIDLRDTDKSPYFARTEFTKIEGNAHAQSFICRWATFLKNAHAQTIICTQLFAGKLTNQNLEYYKVNNSNILFNHSRIFGSYKQIR